MAEGPFGWVATTWEKEMWPPRNKIAGHSLEGQPERDMAGAKRWLRKGDAEDG